jgi:hypothetical protein
MRHRLVLVLLAGALAALAAPRAGAQSLLDHDRTVEGRSRRLLVPIGVSVSVGGGFATFTQAAPRDVAGTAASWEARAAIGTRTPFALELAYLGSVQTIDALGLDDGALLVGQGGEAAVRMNLYDDAWQPYVLAGVAVRRYRVATDTNTSDIAGGDDVTEMPLGFGAAFRYQGLVVDGRATFRTAFGDQLLATRGELDTLGASLTLGWEL